MVPQAVFQTIAGSNVDYRPVLLALRRSREQQGKSLGAVPSDVRSEADDLGHSWQDLEIAFFFLRLPRPQERCREVAAGNEPRRSWKPAGRLKTSLQVTNKRLRDAAGVAASFATCLRRMAVAASKRQSLSEALVLTVNSSAYFCR